MFRAGSSIEIGRAGRRCRKGDGPRMRQQRGAVAVEAAVCLTVIVLLVMGLWEVGRMVQLSRTLNDAARQGARLAAGGANNGTAVTADMVQQAVQNYLKAAGFTTTAANGASVTLTNLSTHTWTDPCDAQPLDPFSVTVTVSGTALSSMFWVPSSITQVNQLSATAQWLSANDAAVSVSTTIPYY
jgi:Flp pilus assembly protein TadG